ncbi:pilus motility taxis protein HmpF [Myxosarcina sp. GI1]|uniref:pilus motility taxis protein HmpF n=1 Tax=Myxosarcina sp. GI1 TaxID=1541065 RepID=UPI0005653BE5|nr:pilus motility taxis protein HmpF [Myxosarcina sp. GI1]
MLYLAEIQKQSKGFMSGKETKLKLLACQRNDQTWSIINGNETVELEESYDFGNGALVTIDLGVNRQLQSNPESASQKIIGILQGFTRLIEKTKNQEQEIEQWKESLTIQSEELSRREIEMEARLEQLEQIEEESERLEQQRQEIAHAQAEVEKIKAEFETKSQELAGAWAQLKGQQEDLEQQLQESKVLDEAQATQIREQLQTLSSALDSNNLIKDKLHLVFEAVNTQQGAVNPNWQKLEQYLQDVREKERELSECKARLEHSQQDLQLLTESLAETERQLRSEQKSLAVKQELSEFLNSQRQTYATVLEALDDSRVKSSGREGQKLDLKALENMPLPDLEKTVGELQKDLDRVARFVNDQEEELSWQCKAVEELEAKISEVNEFERLTLEQELADEKEAQKMLNQTLVGQRRSLKERYEILLQHIRILKRRQGIIDLEAESQGVDLEPIVQSLQQQQQTLAEQQEQLEREITTIAQNIERLEAEITEKTERQAQLKTELQQQQDKDRQLSIELTALKFKSEFGQENLQPLQNILDNLHKELEAIEGAIADYSQKNPILALDEVNRILQELTA